MIPKSYCRELAKTITHEQVIFMLKNAQANITDWTVRSRVNKMFSRGKHWNMFTRSVGFSILSEILIYRLLEEYGDYLPIELKPVKKKKSDFPPPHHEDPIFI